MPDIELSIVVPVFGNATTLAELSARLEATLGSRDFELVFVDDASPDRARAEIRRLTRTRSQVQVVELDENVGQNAAVLVGLRRARGHVVAVMDADLQDLPEALPVLLEVLVRQKLDVVFAARRGKFESFSRLVTSRSLKALLWLLTRFKLPPSAGLFLVMDRRVLDRLLPSVGPDPYLLVAITNAAERVASVPVERVAAHESSYTLRMRCRVAKRALATAVRR